LSARRPVFGLYLTESHRMRQTASLKILNARKAEPKEWTITWRPASGFVSVLRGGVDLFWQPRFGNRHDQASVPDTLGRSTLRGHSAEPATLKISTGSTT
jgi:hypothetical protein